MTKSKTLLSFAVLMVALMATSHVSAFQTLTPDQRLDMDIKFLASDELEGREPGSKGIETAAQYIIDSWKEFNVPSGVEDGSYRQDFTINMGTVIDKEKTIVSFNGPGDNAVAAELDTTFRPLMLGGKGEVKDADVVFVGYSIDAEEYNYQDYKNFECEGKVVVFLRMEPQQKDGESVFNGTNTTDHARLSNKLAAAKKAGAVAAILVNDGLRPVDEIAQTSEFGRAGDIEMPLFHVSRSVINEVLAVTPLMAPTGDELNSLDDVEALIDQTLEPIPQAFEGWKVTCNAAFTENSVVTSNIVGVIEGEGPNADETIVIGGHYDHLGFGGYGSNAPNRREIHNGADDNATGTGGIIELARRFANAESKPGRRLVFVAFSGEERGLLGSAYYVENPVFPLDKTVAMINYDMIGRLRDEKLTIFGTGCGDTFDAICDAANDPESPLELDKKPSPFAGSDHMAFVGREIPVMFLHTGLTEIYHTPEDDYETLNIPGACRVVDYTERLISEMANAETAPTFQQVSSSRPRRRASYLGVRLDYESDDRGVLVQEDPAEGSPSAKAGFQGGDVITSFNGEEIRDRGELGDFLRANRPGTEVEVKFLRDDEEMSATVELGQTPRRRTRNRDENSEKKPGDSNKKGG